VTSAKLLFIAELKELAKAGDWDKYYTKTRRRQLESNLVSFRDWVRIWVNWSGQPCIGKRRVMSNRNYQIEMRRS
jgi:hypothetical protein